MEIPCSKPSRFTPGCGVGLGTARQEKALLKDWRHTLANGWTLFHSGKELFIFPAQLWVCGGVGDGGSMGSENTAFSLVGFLCKANSTDCPQIREQ